MTAPGHPGDLAAAADQLTFHDLLQIVDVIRNSSQFSEVRVRTGGIEIDLRRAGAAPERAPSANGHASAANGTSHLGHTPSSSPVPLTRLSEPALTTAAAPTPPAVGPVTTPPRTLPANAVTITSPMVGTFYRAPEPGAQPFVHIGQRVEHDTIVCIIEVMKLMTSQPAGVRGEVIDVLVADGQPVEHGQPLIVVAPSS